MLLHLCSAPAARSHTAVGIEHDVLDAHNMARYHVAGSFYQINVSADPPACVLLSGPHRPLSLLRAGYLEPSWLRQQPHRARRGQGRRPVGARPQQ